MRCQQDCWGLRLTGALSGKRAIVTGGGSGIGKGIALVLVEQGASVALIGRRLERLQSVVDLVRQHGGTAHAIAGDVRDRAQITAAVGKAQAALGGLDILVNNAGIGGVNGCALDGPDRWDDIIRTNLDGLFFTTRAAAPFLPDGARIVSISSVLGRFGVPGYTAYCTSKHGVVGFTKALALELAPRRITVNAICPGWVDTDMAKTGMEGLAQAMGMTFESARSAALAMVPLGSLLQPSEIGATVAFLCSNGAKGMTGQTLSHCGGQVMW